jgi:hypothetical protein
MKDASLLQESLTFVVKLAAMLHDTGLAVARLVALVIVTSIVPIEVLRRIHATTVDSIYVHLLHTIRKHVRIVSAGLVGGTLGSRLGSPLRDTALRDTLRAAVAVHGIIPVVVVVVEVVVHDRSARWSVAHGCWGGSCGTRPKGSSTGLQGRLDGGVGWLLTADSSVVRRKFTTVTTMNGTSRNATEAGVVVVEMLLSVGVGLGG